MSKKINSKIKLAAYKKAKQEGKKYEDGMPQGSGPENRHGMPQLPPGQKEVKNWPVLDLGEHPNVQLSNWKLEVNGLVERPEIFNWDSIMALPIVSDVSDFHCVTTWSRYDNHWKGIRLFDLANKVGLKKEVAHIIFEGYDKDMNGVPYTTNIPLEEGMKEDVLLVFEWEGQPLPIEHGGPMRVITPQLYAWKGTKWVKRITFVEKDEPGYWELRGYSNSAEPWLNDRYSY